MSAQDIDLACYENIIGVSRTTCECYEPSLYSESKSDLYIDELQGMNLRLLKQLERCEDSENIWLVLGKIRDNAILNCINDITAGLSKKYSQKRQPFLGAIGKKKWNTTLNLKHTYAGARWVCADIVAGNLKIKNIMTAFNKTGVVQVYVYNNMNEKVAGPYNLNTLANQVCTNNITLELPAHSNYVDNLEYFFVYQVDPTMKPLNIDSDCSSGCSGFSYKFDVNNPYFNSQSNKKKGWADYILCGSWEDDSLDSFQDVSTTTGSYLNGLMFDVEFGCKLQEVICVNSIDYVNNLIALTLAFMVQYKSGEIALTNWMMTGELDRYSMINTEQANNLAGFYMKKYQEYLGIIIDQIDIKTTDCFECKDFIVMVRKGILA